MNWEMLNDAEYQYYPTVKRFLRKMQQLKHCARKGDSVAHSIYLDLRYAVYAKDVLSFKQRRYIQLWIDGYKVMDIAQKYRVSPATVTQTIKRGSKNISTYLR
jgi:DNA-binding CsgD family transcriptional regulator